MPRRGFKTVTSSADARRGGDLSGLVLLDFCGAPLAFSLEEIEDAKARAQSLLGPSAPSSPAGSSGEPLLDAEQLAELLRIPVTWIEQKARQGVIPSLEFGRWRRFRRSEVEAAVRTSR